jgi:imidazoleglycerol-phosphate dehydratase
MDDAVSEAAIDASGRPFLVYQAEYPQIYSGSFDLSLLREFFLGFVNRGALTLHAVCRYGSNSHHMAESLFKAVGIALGKSLSEDERGVVPSTKGSII